MKPIHLILNFVVPVLFYLSVVMYFFSGVSILASISGGDPGFLVIGFITFVLAYNAWFFANKFRKEDL